MTVTVNCDNCGSDLEKYQSHVNDKNFCDRDCLGNWQSENHRGKNHPNYSKVEVSCHNCGEIFSRKPSLVEKSEKNFCDMECRNNSYNEDQWDFGPEETQLNIECNNCGQIFGKHPSRIQRSKYDFCSKGCHYEYYSENNLRSKEKNPFWDGGETHYYGPNWEESRDQRLSEDNYCCVRCGMDGEESKDRYGCSLNIHHIVPIKSFNGDYDSANELENLVTLCNSCHITMEVLSPQEQKRVLFNGE